MSKPPSAVSLPSVFGEEDTQFFFDLTPERILASVESLGYRCTGRCLPLNSMENRVYEVEIDLDEQPKSPSERFRIVKFYRPGRWSEAQILEEHRFLLDLVEYELPVVPPLQSADGETLFTIADTRIFFAVFPKVGGRSPDELSADQLGQIGRLIARLHNVGGTRTAEQRIHCTPEALLLNGLDYLLDSQTIPEELEARYESVVESIYDRSVGLFEGVEFQRIHGDCHLRNLLWNSSGLTIVDFDDMMVGPCVQDLWLLVPGRDRDSVEQLDKILAGYEQMREFDQSTLRLIEPLRAMRMVHFSAWIGKRWDDPAFPAAFPAFSTPRYWQDQVLDLQELLSIIDEGGWGVSQGQQDW